MFQFTREFIINDLKGNLTVTSASDYTSVSADTPNAVKSKIAVVGDTILIENLINIDKKSIYKVYKTEHQDKAAEVIKWAPTVTNIEVGDVVRVIATLYQDDNVVATFASPVPNTGRTVQYEFIATTANTLVAGQVEDLYATMNVTTSAITITAKDCFTRVGKIEIVKDAVSDSNIGVGVAKVASIKKSEFTNEQGAFVTALNGSQLGTPGLGNTAQILRNMRLQTDANLNPYGLDIDERPVTNGEYDMYTVELVTERRNIGHNVMGSVGTSLTTLVFYVSTADNVSTNFASLFEEVGINTITNGKSDMGTTGEGETADDVVVTGKEPGILLDEE